MKTIAIIPAGGKGLRTGKSIPKQFLKFDGRELIAYTLETFQKSSLINEIIISVAPAYFNRMKKIIQKNNFTKILKVVEGGKERQDSVYNALLSIDRKEEAVVVIHDAVRPFLSKELLNKAIVTAKQKGNAIVAIKCRDTLVKGNNDSAKTYVDRNKIYYIQTPQVFKYSDLMHSMKLAKKMKLKGTDESMLVKNAGYKINLVEGSILNFKITEAEDIKILKKILKVVP